MTRHLRAARRLVRKVAKEGWGVFTDWLRWLLYCAGALALAALLYVVGMLVAGVPVTLRWPL